MQFEVDDQLSGLLDELDEWAAAQVQATEQEAAKLDVTPRFLTPQDFWAASQTTPEGLFKDALLDEQPAPESKDEENDPALQTLHSKLEASDVLLSHVNAALLDLNMIEAQHRLVADKTQSLHEVCKRLLAEQTKLDKVVAGIQGPMSYFASYEDIAPRLGVSLEPGLSNPRVKQRVLHPDDAQFKKDLARLDECMAFVEAHPHYRDHDIYITRFRNLQSQAMNMIKNWVIEEITKLTESASLHLNKASSTAGKAAGSSVTSVSFLDNPHLYSRFIERANILRPSIIELERRPAVSVAALRESLTKLCSSRARLLKSIVMTSPEIQGKGDNALVSRVLLASSFLGRFCSAEYGLVSSFFSIPTVRTILMQSARDSGLSNLLEGPVRSDYDRSTDGDDESEEQVHVNPFADEMENVCSCLYDALRPMVVREDNLERLCDGSSAIESAIQDLDARMDRDAAEPLERVLMRLAFDIQERLVFCAARIIRDQVMAASFPNEFYDKPNNERWFPTLEITLDTLSKVYRCVEQSVFEHLAAEAVAACTKSLCDAARRIAKRVSPDDADLFLVKHLLILREQILPFRAALSVREHRLDFGSTSRALRQLFARSSGSGGVSNQQKQRRSADLINLIRFAAPKAQESDVDTRKEMDAELRRASESYILRVSKRALGPMLEFVDASQAFLQQENATWDGLVAQDFASNASVAKAVEYCENKTLNEIQQAREKTARYLNNPQTRSLLFTAIEANAFKVMNSASNFTLDLFKEDASLNDRLRELIRVVASLRASTHHHPASPSASVVSRASQAVSPPSQRADSSS